MKKHLLKLIYMKRITLTFFQIICIVFALQLPLFCQEELPAPPYNYDYYNPDIPHGTTKVVPYWSSTVGIYRNTRILLPPGYSKDSTYNVLYLLHGIGGDINEWYSNGVPQYILDNLYAKGFVEPMIVVLPNGRAMVDDSPGADIYAPEKLEGFKNFEFELIKDLVPFIDTAYNINPGPQSRALAGLSMGGGQSLDFGLAHLDTFAWVGAFSPAPNTYAPDSLFPNLTEDTAKISSLWLSCGTSDGLLFITQNTHSFLTDNNIDHYYWLKSGAGHDWTVWKPSLYYFSQRIFGNVPHVDTASPPVNLFQFPDNPVVKLNYDPASQTITLQDIDYIKKLSIYNINGCLLFSETNISNNIIDISRLSNGTYLITIFDGERVIHTKIIKF
jgi:enterochelin esterase-like enzyme